MARRKTKTVRVTGKFEENLMKVGDERVKKGLAVSREIRMPEMTDLLTRTQGFQISLEELRTKPKKSK